MDRLATFRAVDAADPTGLRLRQAFTLIELMVVTVLIISLAGLALAGMGVARQRAKIDKTKSTIRKLHEIIVPHYESYVRRRVPLLNTSTNARVLAEQRLQRLRTLTLFEMPDSWGDVANSAIDLRAGDGTAPAGSGTVAIPAFAQSGSVRAYAAIRAAVNALEFTTNSSSECLYLIASRGTGEPEMMDQFRQDEVGDTDGDRAPEFIDGWGTAIGFVRWPAGAHKLTPPSPLQPADGVTRHDPFDPQRVDTGPGYGLFPLIFSAGPDRLGGVNVTPDNGWAPLAASAQGLVTVTSTNSTIPQLLGSPVDPFVTRDNITNHDLTTK
jgi:competence protein ComGC